MHEELLEGLYSYENNEYGFKVKNISYKERNEVYDRICKLKNKYKFDDDEFTFEMFKELVECSGKINFKKMKIKDFEKILNSDNVKEVFEELCFYVGIGVSRIIKTGLREQQIKIEKQEIELASTYLGLTMENCINLTRDIERSQLAKKKLKKQINMMKNYNFEEIEKVLDIINDQKEE